MPFLAHLGTGVFIDDITETVSESSISISDSMESGADSMSFQAYIYDKQFSIQAGMEIRLYGQVGKVTGWTGGGGNFVIGTTVFDVDFLAYVGDILAFRSSGDSGGEIIELIRVTAVNGYQITVQRNITGNTLTWTGNTNQPVYSFEFAGNIISVAIEAAGDRLAIYSCDARDYVYMLDRRHVNKSYTEKPISTGIKRTDADKSASDEGIIEEILYDLRNDADNDKGIYSIDAYYDAFYTNINPINIEVGPSIKAQTLKRVQPSQAISSVTEMGGYMWWMDFAKQVHVESIANQPAKHLPIDYGDYVLDIDNNTNDYSNLTVETSISGVGTKAIIAEPLVKSTTQITQVFSLPSGFNLSGESLYLQLSNRPFSLIDVVELKIVRGGGGTDYVVGIGGGTTYALLELEHVNRLASDNTNGASSGSHKAWIDLGPVNNKTARLRFAPDAITHSGDKVHITYNYMEKNDHFSRRADAQEEMRRITGGDGVHEFVYSRGSEITAQSAKDMDNIASAILFRKSKISIHGNFTSFTKGWKAGQIFRLKWIRENIDQTVWVVNVGKSIMSSTDNDNSIIRHNIAFANVPRGIRGA